MPATPLNREQKRKFELLESVFPSVHYSLHDSRALTRKEEDQFFNFYITLKRIEKRLEVSHG